MTMTFVAMATTMARWTAAANTAPPHVNGTWRQVYTNTFVQGTTEIDWRCVVVDVTLVNGSRADIRKSARLHGGPVIINVTTHVEFDESTLAFRKDVGMFAPSLRSMPTHLTYNLHPFDNQTWVITGQEEPSVVVWTQDEGSGSEPQDISRLSEYLEELDFDPPDDEYKKLILTYDTTLC